MAGQNFSVINNLQSYTAQNNLGTSRAGMNKNLNKLSSGFRIIEAGDDAAGLAIANGLKADFTALNQGIRNINDGIGIGQIADGALSQMGGMLDRAIQLATQAASDTVGDSERDTLNVEFQQILEEIDRVTETTNFKGENLFDPNGPVTKNIFVGDTQTQSSITISIGGPGGAGTAAMGLAGTSISTAEDAQALLSQLSDAKSMVSRFRGTIGAQQNRLINSVSIMQTQSLNLMAAESTIRDANMADEMSSFIKNRILTESGMASLAQSNASSQLILSLFRQ